MESSPTRVVSILQEAWAEIAQPSQREELTDDLVERMVSRLSVSRWEAPAVDPGELRGVCKAKGDSAMGPDRIPWKVLDLMSHQAWVVLAGILNQIENVGEWPQPLLDIALVPVPKRESQGPVRADKMRMISVSSHVYQSWASLRAAQLADWVASTVPKQVHGGVRGRSAARASHEEAIQWDISSGKRRPWMIAYCDASKCFDLLRFGDLHKIMSRLGVDDHFNPKREPGRSSNRDG